MAAGPSIDVTWLEEQLAQASPDLLRYTGVMFWLRWKRLAGS
jgi:hypothetical protein